MDKLQNELKKKDLVELIASKTGENKKVVETIVDATFSEIIESLKRQEIVNIYGFGKFRYVYKEEHQAKNPKTGELVTIPGKGKAKMSYSSAVLKYINQ